MPIFKTTHNILFKVDEDEYYTENYLDSDKLCLPPWHPWGYEREMHIEDVDIWEVLYEATDGIGIYASYVPFAEFYMITPGFDYKFNPRYVNEFAYWYKQIETFYGNGAETQVRQRAKELNIPLVINQIWVEDEFAWLYDNSFKDEKRRFI
jgi:hypothetical protein